MIKKFLKPVGRGIPATVDPLVKRAVVQLEEHAQDLAARATSLETGHSWLARQDFQASGYYTPTSGTTRVVLRGSGGGGGGGGAGGGGGVAGGAGGASGSYYELVLAGPITGGAVIIGAGGAGGVGIATGSSGGVSTIIISGVTYTFNGGGGGGAMASSTTIAVAGGGTVTGPGGQHGFPGLVTNTGAMPGNGGSNLWGTGGYAPQGGFANGGNGQGFGAGGAGANTSTVNRNGGAGTGGRIIIDEYR